MDEAAWDVVVIGAGAAGLMAALRAAERGRRTVLLEKNRKAGVKILMSGGTRCNITQATDNRGIVEAYGPPGRFLHSALAALSVEQTIALFEAKVFPVSNKATDVLAALLRRLQRSGATLALDEPVLDMRRQEDRFTLTTNRRAISAERVILTSGGQSYPGSGTTGDGYRFLREFGHTIVPPRPALVPITVTLPWIEGLRGVTLLDVALRVLDGERTLDRRRGGFLFAHFGLSGPVVLDISRVVSGHPQPATLLLEIDFLPAQSEDELSEFLRAESIASGKKQLAGVLSAHLPRRLCDALLALAGLPVDRKAAALSKEDRRRLVQTIKRLRIPITGTLGFQKAEVTAGGVDLSEVDSRTMRSKIVPGLWIAGEVLDLDGPIGGYNFQAAWSTGWLAGSTV
jgi:predicted Rossmann fold flavoprotein